MRLFFFRTDGAEDTSPNCFLFFCGGGLLFSFGESLFAFPSFLCLNRSIGFFVFVVQSAPVLLTNVSLGVVVSCPVKTALFSFLESSSVFIGSPRSAVLSDSFSFETACRCAGVLSLSWL